MRSRAHLVRNIEIIPNGYVLSFDPWQPGTSTLSRELRDVLQALRRLRALEKVVVRLGVSDSREEESVGRVGALCRHALEWVGGKRGRVVAVD